MYPLPRIRSFVNRYPLAGPIVWLLAIQFFIVQIIVAAAWANPTYSWRLNAISDLGSTKCGKFDDRYVCSPSHGLMNISLILLGVCMVVGSVFLYQQFRKSRLGFYLMGVAGIGAFLVGIYPEDTTFWVHVTGQDLAFLFGNIALITIGLSLSLARWFRWYSVMSGVVALVGLYLFLSHHRFFLELGGMERVVAYPLTIWLITFGLYMSLARYRLAEKHPIKQQRKADS
jgi:hypothetical membrane protein